MRNEIDKKYNYIYFFFVLKKTIIKEMSQDNTQGQIIKIQNKIANFLETNTHFSERRNQFVLLNKQYRGLTKEERP